MSNNVYLFGILVIILYSVILIMNITRITNTDKNNQLTTTSYTDKNNQLTTTSYPEYFAYYQGMVDPYAGINELWCRNNTSIYGCDNMIKSHKTVFLTHRSWVPSSNYIKSLNWIASQKAIENVFVGLNITDDNGVFNQICTWQKKYNKIKAVYIADEPVSNKSDKNLLLTSIKKLKSKGSGFEDVKLFCVFAYPVLSNTCFYEVTSFIRFFSTNEFPIDWIGFDYYCQDTGVDDVIRDWENYKVYANNLKQIAASSNPQPKLIVVPQLAVGKNFGERSQQLTSFIWNKLIINWGLRNNVVAIIPFIFLLSMMEIPENRKELTHYSYSPFTHLEDTRKAIENGEGLIICNENCKIDADMDNIYPLQSFNCEAGICGEYYLGGNENEDYCCSYTYKKDNGWVYNTDNNLCCVLKHNISCVLKQ